MADATVVSRPRRRSLGVRIAAPLVVLAVALAIGSGAFSSRPQTAAQRATAIESVVRCPSCIDVSVLDSSETTAVAVRHQIQKMVGQGDSAAQIEATLVSQYGRNILLDPGGFAVIWIVPIVLAALALVAVGTLFWRRSRAFAATAAARTQTEAPSPSVSPSPSPSPTTAESPS
jgi:cytochrome c-type biogenesis protein CcmH/NrfF